MDNLATEPTETDLELEESTEEGEELETPEGEQSESESEELEAEGDAKELLSLDGEEVDLDTVRKWKAGHLMQEDYTRKTQATAEERKALKATAEMLDSIVSELEKELLSDFDAKELEELRDYDPSAYLKRKEKLDARKAKIASARSQAAKKRDELEESAAVEERAFLIKENPHWVDSYGSPTKAFEDDKQLMNNYLRDKGWSDKDIAKVSTGKMWSVIKEAAQFKAGKAKSESIKQKVKQAPMVTKPRSNSAPAKQKSIAELLYGA